ncbi:Ribosomal protein S6 [Candidatus Magnetomorum sp. HK-1]|nr:Ribosomal protein S6 [Candidatus Magnetomorum sp. HK-1]
MKRRYETILLFDIDAGDETREAFLTRSKALMEQFNGNLLDQDVWGVRKLAYEVRRKTRGYYVRLDYYAQKEMIEEFERIIRLEDSVMKYLTILLEDTFDPEQYERDQSQALESDIEENASDLEDVPPLTDDNSDIDDDVVDDVVVEKADVEETKDILSEPLDDTSDASGETKENE